MGTTTTNYSFGLPTIDGDADSWGTQLNANWTKTDGLLSGSQDLSTLSVTTSVTLKGQGDLILADADSSHSVSLQAAATIGTSYTLTLPAADGSNGQVLATDGSGNLSFTTISGFDGAFSSLSGTPTTISGYGITDAFDGAFSSLSGKPTSLSGYGITDAVAQLADASSPNYQTPSSRRVDPNASNPTNEHYAISTFGNGGNVTGQVAAHFQTGQLYSRGYNTSFSAWRKIWNDANDGSGSGLDADTVDGIQGANFIRSDTSDTIAGSYTFTNQKVLVASNYGCGVYGLYSASRYQHVWSMGTSYNLVADGTGTGNLYGISWTHTNVGTGANQAISGLSHQMQIRANGNLWTAIGYGVHTLGNVTAFSDRAVKRNLERIPNALEKVCLVNGYTYERSDYEKDPDDPNSPEIFRQAGVVAQEIEAVLPEVVTGEEGVKAVAYGNMAGLFIEAIKELKAEVNDLRSEVALLKTQVEGDND